MRLYIIARLFVKSFILAMSLLLLYQERSSSSDKLTQHPKTIFTGLTELGPSIGLRHKLGPNRHADFSINYFPFQYRYQIKEININSHISLSSKSFGIDIRQYLERNKLNSGFYASAGIKLHVLRLSSRIPLSDGSYNLGEIKLSCSKCPDAIASIKNEFRVVPGISFGYSSGLTKNLSFDFSAGIQYFLPPVVGWKSDESEFQIPYFVADELNNSVDKLNDQISLFFPWIPIVRVSMIYKF